MLGLNVPITQIANPIPGRSIAAGMTYSISPTMTNEFNWGFTHNSILIAEAGNVLNSTKDGINLPVLYPTAVQDNYIPNVTFNGTRISASPAFGTGDAPFINYNTTIDISDNLTKVWGKHTIKGGVYMQRSRKNQTSFANFNGSYNFGDNTSNPYRHRLRFLECADRRLQHLQSGRATISTVCTATGTSKGSCRIRGRLRRV